MFHNNTESFISENCSLCQVELIHTEDILIDIESDAVLCLECAQYHHIKTSKCKECL